MNSTVGEALDRLTTLEPELLRDTAEKLRSELASAEWRMGVCLLACERNKTVFQERGFGSLREFAMKALHLSDKKVWELLSVAKILERLPKISRAFREGRLCWAKLRAIKGMLTPEAEDEWLEFGLAHSASEIERATKFTPKEWKRFRAMEASRTQAPICTGTEVEEVLREAIARVEAQDQASSSHTTETLEPEPGRSEKVESLGPGQPQKKRVIRFQVEMSPDEFALYERAVQRVQARCRKRVRRGSAIAHMAESLLNEGSASSRAKHQVIIHTLSDLGMAWYETEKGTLPVDPEIFKKALEEREPTYVSNEGAEIRAKGPTSVYSTATGRRTAVPNAVLRELHARASQRCQRCETTQGPFEIHHKVRVSEGGSHQLDTLELLCHACHSQEHREDFVTKSHWVEARERARTRRTADDP